MTRYAVALGSNLGDRLSYLRAGVAGLSEIGTVTGVSRVYETRPVGGPDQGPFLNGLVVVEATLQPLGLLEACQRIESESGRVRSEQWGPRTLDVDIVTSDGPEFDHERLQIPHPLASVRPFVLAPLVDVWPDAPLGAGLDARTAFVRTGDEGLRLYAEAWV